jgi:hypothetical protein
MAVKQRYLSKRSGSVPTGKKNRSTGQPLVPPPKLVPMTTWGDAVAVWANLKRIAEPTLAQCRAQAQALFKVDAIMGDKLCILGPGALSMLGPPSPAQIAAYKVATGTTKPLREVFVQTANWQRAKRDFDAQNPMLTPGFGPQKLVSGELYPRNEELWGYADDYVIARGAAGVVPFPFDMAVDSVIEAIKELPSTIRSAMNAVVPDVSLGWLDDLKEIMKWTAVGGGLFMLYWYVLRSKRGGGGEAG